MADSFQLTLLLPDQILLSTQVSRVGGEAVNGSFVVLPRHIDFCCGPGAGPSLLP